MEGTLRELRRLLYCGEWIASHTLHIGLLHAPDFLGYESGIDIAADHPDRIEGILAIKKTGNALMELLGGRPIHPVNVKLGGFYRAPSRAELDALVPVLEDARVRAEELVRWTAGFEFPDLSLDYEFVSLRHPDEYPFNEGRIVLEPRGSTSMRPSSRTGVAEEHVEHSTALHARLTDGGWYHAGPLARYANNRDLLPTPIRELATDVGLEPVVTNPFKSIVVRSLEVLFALDEALRIIASYQPPDRPAVAVPPTAGTGWAATEAPRGLLYHRYQTAADGLIERAQIIPPTSQNQPTIESDLRAFVAGNLDLDREELERRCEQAIRNYDPCISCATHFLTLTIDESAQ